MKATVQQCVSGIAAALLASACAPPNPEPLPTIHIAVQGRVVHNGVGMADVSVSGGEDVEAWDTTEKDGHFTLEAVKKLRNTDVETDLTIEIHASGLSEANVYELALEGDHGDAIEVDMGSLEVSLGSDALPPYLVAWDASDGVYLLLSEPVDLDTVQGRVHFRHERCPDQTKTASSHQITKRGNVVALSVGAPLCSFTVSSCSGDSCVPTSVSEPMNPYGVILDPGITDLHGNTTPNELVGLI